MYPEGTVTVPVPFGESTKSPFEFVVETVFPFAFMLSTLKLVTPVNPPLAKVAVPSVREAPVIVELALSVVTLAAAAELAPITAPSILPPSISGVLISGLVNVLLLSVCVAVSDIRLLPAEGNTKTLEAEAL